MTEDGLEMDKSSNKVGANQAIDLEVENKQDSSVNQTNKIRL